MLLERKHQQGDLAVCGCLAVELPIVADTLLGVGSLLSVHVCVLTGSLRVLHKHHHGPLSQTVWGELAAPATGYGHLLCWHVAHVALAAP